MLESSPLGFQRLRTGGCAGRLRQIIEHFLVEISSELEEEEPTKEIPVAEKAGFWSILLDFFELFLTKTIIKYNLYCFRPGYFEVRTYGTQKREPSSRNPK